MNAGFQYFPERLYSKPVKMININSLFNFMSRPQEIFYSIKDGNWNDISVWQTVSGRSGKLPSATDDVYVRHTVTLNTTTAVNNLFVSGTFKADNSSRVITVNGDLQATGTIDFTSSNVNIQLYGFNNYVASFTSGTSSTVTYAALAYDQNIMALSYRNLTTTNKGVKYLISNLTVTGNVNVNSSSTLELSTYDLTVNGTTTSAATLSKTGAGNLLFIGKLSNNFGNIIFSGNPSIELRGGFIKFSVGNTINMGSGVISFTTNNQTVSLAGGGEIIKFTNVLIVGNITLTEVGSTWQIDSYIDGTTSSSTLVNNGSIYFNSTTLPMATHGIFDYTSFANTIGYVMSGNFTFPYTNYSSLLINNTVGTKTLGGNTTLTGNLTQNAGTLDTSTFDLTVSGTSTFNATFAWYFIGGTGNLLFIGALTIGSSGSSTFDLSSNPNIECRGGIITTANMTIIGAAIFSFTTNNQTLSIGGSFNFGTCPLLISGAITLTVTTSGILTTGNINGNNASSILDNRGTLHYRDAVAPMVTGKLYCNQAANTWFYDLSGNQDIQVPSDATPGYKNLTLAGSGAKRLLGNVSVKGTYTLTSPATLDSNGFALTNP